MKKHTVVITEDHELLRNAWSSIINKDPRFEVIGECASAEKAIELVETLTPDIILMDINLPGMNGIEATEILLKMLPTTKIIGCSTHKQPEYARKMIQKGALGYVSKFAPLNELMNALIEVSKGNKYMCNTIKEVLAEEMLSGNNNSLKIGMLTSRETEIIELIKQGLSSREIAKFLCLSTNTIEVHRYNILKKLNLNNRASLISYLHKNKVA